MKINKKFLIKISLTVAGLILQSNLLFAQEATTANENVLGPAYYKILGILFFIIILAIIYAFMYFGTEEIEEEEKVVGEPEKASLWARIRQSMTKAAPLDKEDEILMEDD